MITLELLQQTVRDALCRATWLNAPMGTNPADSGICEAHRTDIARLEAKLLSGTTEDGWHFVVASFLRDDKPGVRGYSGMATRSGLIVHLTCGEAEDGFVMAMRGMN
jgi:hypothetical protein